MEITYLGTAAAEGIPGIYCGCETCRRAIAAGGRNIMTRSQALIDGKLLIDLGPDTYMHFLRLGRTMYDIEHVLITHSHSDHFAYNEMSLRPAGMAHEVTAERLKIYAEAALAGKIAAETERQHMMSAELFDTCFQTVPLTPYVTVDAGGYAVTPLPAQHPAPEQPLIYLIERGGKTLFYGNDTGLFGTDIDDWLCANGKHIDVLSLDCTKEDNPFDYNSHMSMAENKALADRFAARGLIDGNTKRIMTHFSHNGHMIYDDLVKHAEKYGFAVAYDGLTVTL